MDTKTTTRVLVTTAALAVLPTPSVRAQQHVPPKAVTKPRVSTPPSRVIGKRLGYGPTSSCDDVLDFIKRCSTPGTDPSCSQYIGLTGTSAISLPDAGLATSSGDTKHLNSTTYQIAGSVTYAPFSGYSSGTCKATTVTRTVVISVGKWSPGKMSVSITDEDKSSGAVTRYVNSAAATLTCGLNQNQVSLTGSLYKQDNAGEGWYPFVVAFSPVVPIN